MATRPKQTNVIPPLTNWGGVRSIQRRLGRNATILANKEAISYSMLCIVNTLATEIFTWGPDGKLIIKPSNEIPEHALQSIKSVKERVDKDGNSTLDIEFYDKVAVLRILAKAAGLLDNPDDGSEKPSVIDINVVAPRGE
jgi:hypothetical protein